MDIQVSLPHVVLEQTIQRIFATRKITRHDQRLLMDMLSNQMVISPQMVDLINSVHAALYRGLLRVVD
jgi:hypothetical protein